MPGRASARRLSLRHGHAKELYVRNMFSQQLVFSFGSPPCPPAPAHSLPCTQLRAWPAPAHHTPGARPAPALRIYENKTKAELGRTKHHESLAGAPTHAGLGAQPLSEPTIEMQGARRSSLHRASEAQSTHGCSCGFVLGQGHKAPLLPRYPRLPALPSSRMGCPGGAHSPSSSGGGKAGGWPKELGDKAGAWRHVGAHRGTTGSVGQAESTAGAGGHGDDRGTWAVDHLSAWTQTLRHNPGVCTPEMGSHQINAGWAEPGSRAQGGSLGTSPDLQGRMARLSPRLPSPCHGPTIVQPLLGCRCVQGRK